MDSSVIRNELPYAKSKFAKLLNDATGEEVTEESVML